MNQASARLLISWDARESFPIFQSVFKLTRSELDSVNVSTKERPITMKLYMLAVLLPLTLGACGSEPAAEGSKESAAPVLSEAKEVKQAIELSAEAVRGKTVFLRCRSCHTVEEGGPHLTGPNLHAMFGATAGEKEGYAFSEALAASTIVWLPETLDQWMQQPRTFIPKNKMAFAGLPNEEDRKALVSYLQEVTE